jgi:hypothetical protein
MQFVQIGMLGALGALAIPIIIHLMFRHRARPVDLGTLQFLKVVLRDNARRRRLKRWILLALRMACVALVSLLFARPYLVATEPRGDERLVVVLLDRSASTGLRGGARPIERALAEATSILDRSGERTQLEIGLFDRAVRPLPAPSELRRAAIEPTASGTDYAAALAWARDLLVRSSKKVKELHILTDLQRSGLGRGEPAIVPADVEVHLHDFGRAFPRNVAVTGIGVAPRSVRPGESASITASVFNASPLPAGRCTVRLHITSGGEKRDVEQTVDLDGGAIVSVVLPLEKLPEGLWRGHVEVSTGDELPFDDRRFLAVSVAPPARILLADGDPGRSPYESETYFLQAALRLAPAGERFAASPFDPKAIEYAGGAGLPELEGSAAVVLANVGDLLTNDARRLAGFVERGGGLLVFTGDRVPAGAARALEEAGLGVGEILGPASAADLPWRLERWDARHPVFQPFADPEHGDLRRPAFSTITRIKPGPDVRVLAWFRGGEPAVLERIKGRGKVLWFTSACDRSWSDWPRSRLYVPVTHQMLAYVANLTEGGRIRVETAGDGREPGIIETDDLVHVVNPDPNESDMARCTPEEFAASFGFRLPPRESESQSPATSGATGRAHAPLDGRLRSDELWPWIALTLIGLLLVESFLANRTAA